jgi:hypothetical protein
MCLFQLNMLDTNWDLEVQKGVWHNVTNKMIKIQFFLHQALHYIEIYNFILKHDHKSKTIIVFKDVWIPKSKKVYVFLIFECFEHMDPFLWNILKSKKKMKWFGEHFIRLKEFWNKKNTYPHVFLECFKHTTRLLKHGEFSWKFCSCNFEILKAYFKILMNFLIYSVPMVIFQKFKFL